ncbi:DUF6783 domain-containing protein [uncultured Robinsoniella sp.]
MRHIHPTNRNAHLAESNFQTCSGR